MVSCVLPSDPSARHTTYLSGLLCGHLGQLGFELLKLSLGDLDVARGHQVGTQVGILGLLQGVTVIIDIVLLCKILLGTISHSLSHKQVALCHRSLPLTTQRSFPLVSVMPSFSAMVSEFEVEWR